MTDRTIVTPAAFEALLAEVEELMVELDAATTREDNWQRAAAQCQRELAILSEVRDRALARVVDLELLVRTLTGGGDGG